MSSYPCDQCQEVAFITGTIQETGEPVFLCGAHLGAALGMPGPDGAIGVCEVCVERQGDFTIAVAADGAKITVCAGCKMVLDRKNYLELPEDVQEQVDASAQPLVQAPESSNGHKPKRRRRVAVDKDSDSPLRLAEAPEGEADAVGAAAGASDATAPDSE